MSPIQAVSFDWYRTLVDHRRGSGRGKCYHEHLASAGLRADPWEHQVLYDVFDYYADHYRPRAPEPEKRRCWVEFTRRLFERTRVTGADSEDIEGHAPAIRDIFGPAHFKVYDDVEEALRKLKARGLRLGIVSNWQRGLEHFCYELGVLRWVDVVLASAEAGFEKPDTRIFREVARRMQVPPEQILHVGDSLDEDLPGATAAGLQVVLLDRNNRLGTIEAAKIGNLRELERLLD